jgi:hypothetical protein
LPLGSGDSTQPSPGPHARRKLHSFGGINPAYDPDNASDSPIIFSHTSFLPRFPDEGPSPGMLIDRLNAISPRCPSSLPFKDSEPTTPSLPSADTATGLNPDRDLVILNANNASSGLEEIEEALRQSIRGALMLWKAGRRRCFVTPSASQQEDNEIFLRIVKQTVEDT